MTAQPRKICIVTGTRAEYGLLFWLLKEIELDPALSLQLVVTGTHLEEKFGRTKQEIIADGFKISERVNIELSDDSPASISKSMGLCTIGMGETFERLKPDIIVVLGDRFEILAAAQAAMVARIPIGHIHGGEATEGLIDEAIRHAVTKMSHFHFVAAKTYGERVIQMGERPDSVFVTGAIGLDHFSRLEEISRQELEAFLSMPLNGKLFVVTYHPVTLSEENPAEATAELVSGLSQFPDARIVITGVNADAGNRHIHREFESYAEQNKNHVRLVNSLGSKRYLNLLKLADVVIGNSSSGIIEAPAAKTATVNIGPRQQGRLRASSIIDCAEDRASITKAIERALDPQFRKGLDEISSPYGSGDVSKKIRDILRDAPLDDVLFKKFYDLKGSS